MDSHPTSARSPSPSSFTFLEYGALPATYIIHCLQLSFLHHILLLHKTDPVRVMYMEQLSLPYEKNWANNTNKLLITYELVDHEITDLTKEAWKRKVKQKVVAKAYQDLLKDVHSKSKTKHLHYNNTFSEQGYISQLRYKDACTIFKLRSGTEDCKRNWKSSSVDDVLCRLCGTEEESQEHIVNCPEVSQGPTINLSCLAGNILNDENIRTICSRVELFRKLIAEHSKRDKFEGDDAVKVDVSV